MLRTLEPLTATFTISRWFNEAEIRQFFPEYTPEEFERVVDACERATPADIESLRTTLQMEYEAKLEINRLYFLNFVRL